MQAEKDEAGDRLIRALALDGQLRVTIARTTGVVREIARRHAMSPAAAAATGRVTTAALMLGTTLKDEQVLTIQVRGDGPLGMLRATADAHGTVRAYATEPQGGEGMSVREAVGGGEGSLLEVIKDLGLKDPYHGLVPLVTGSIYEDVAYYLLTSEQTLSAVGLGERLDEEGRPEVCGGYLVQALPGAGDEVEARIAGLPSIDEMLSESALESVLAQLLPDEEVQIVSDVPVRFECTCSRERFAIGLRLVGEEEAMLILRQEGSPLKLRCHFCTEEYYFSESQLKQLFTEN